MNKPKHPGGRPSKYQAISLAQVEKLAGYNLKDEEIADVLEICYATLRNYKKNPDFLAALKKGKDKADNYVVGSLFHRAIGYTHPEEQVFCYRGQIIRAKTFKHYPPDTIACIFWLKNRRRDEWRDRQEIEHVDLNFSQEEREKKLEWLNSFTVDRTTKKKAGIIR